MSDNETETTQTTNISLVKEKKPRTPAQIEATSKALQALAQARRAKAEAKAQAPEQVVAKRTTTTTRIVKPKVSKPKPVPDDVVPSAPPKPVEDYHQNLNKIMGEMASLKEMISNNKKPKRKVVVEESSSDEEEVIIKKKVRTQNKRPLAPTPLAIPPQPTDNRHLLEQIFFRNH